ncbi:MAG TPA: helix-turn-helix transcriptional regulator [Geminicoccus sp.]|uniref:helix-turn-helix domain-containing protein n=1 Tax=Geminicoccus sp. TaxID=2024832 RepID=UPI002BC660BE|nr:helix-turn-helix transcriptional regulator [Geminicoccus sp.]HWL72127.1 helix-turn-helix transcriptional regulator [Geminicoccus sp.]
MTIQADARDSGRADDATKAEFGRRLRGLLAQRGWSQSELARRARIGRDNISGYVRGQNLPGPTILNRIAEALGVDVSELVEVPSSRLDRMRSALQFYANQDLFGDASALARSVLEEAA